jgi:hypothetical protein
MSCLHWSSIPCSGKVCSRVALHTDIPGNGKANRRRHRVQHVTRGKLQLTPGGQLRVYFMTAYQLCVSIGHGSRCFAGMLWAVVLAFVALLAAGLGHI